MKVEKIIFMQTFPTGNYSNQKLGVELSISQAEDWGFGNHFLTQHEAVKHYFEEAKRIVNDAFQSLNPHLQSPEPQSIAQQPVQEIQVEKVNQDSRVQAIINDINTCKEVKVLESYRLLAKMQGGEIESAYNKKMEELSNGR